MKTVLLIGLGRFGKHVAMKLCEMRHQVMAVDSQEKRVNEVFEYVTSVQIGDCTDKEFLNTLGVNNFDVCIVAIGDDFQSSLETTSLLKELGAKLVVARANRDVHARLLQKIGADQVVYPEKQIASWTAVRFTSDHILDYIELDENHGIFELTVPDAWKGKTVGQLDVRRKYNINIMGVKHNGKLMLTVNPDTVLSENITMLVSGNIKDIQKCFRTL